MNIEIKSLSLLNFQGIRKAEHDFSAVTNIYGDNGTGKTTLANAFTWLLFGKDTQDRQQFEVKTLNDENIVIPKLNHEVEAILLIDGTQLVLKRILREKWVKKRGEAEAAFQGNTEEFFADDVPLSKGEYQAKINSLIKEIQFKLITNPLYLNQSMDWKARRDLIFKMAGTITLDDIAKGNDKYMAILPELKSKSIPGYLKMLAERKKKLKKILEEIPPRIDEVSRSIPEEPNTEYLQAELESCEGKLNLINGSLEAINKASSEKADQLKKLQGELAKLVEEKSQMIITATKLAQEANLEQEKEKNRLSQEMETLSMKKNRLKVKLNNITEEINELVELRAKIKEQTLKLDASSFDRDSVQTHCPTCKQELPDANEKIFELEGNFNENKATKIQANIAESQKHRKHIEELQQEHEKLNSEMLQIAESYQQLNESLMAEQQKPNQKSTADNFLAEDYRIQLELIEKKQTEIETFKASGAASVSTEEEHTATEQQELINKIKELNTELGKEKIIREKTARVAELEKEAREYGQQLADIEGNEYLAEQFNKDFINGLEAKANAMFDGFHFRMFRHLVNGGEEEDCTLIYKGVPYNDLNSAAKIQCGIKCINTICNHNNFAAPIWIDNAESVVELPETKAQLIRLIVSEEDKVLRIENN